MRSEQQLENIGRATSSEGDAMVIAACRRIIAADRIGWRKHGRTLDWYIRFFPRREEQDLPTRADANKPRV
jgi:hypothetical protein